MGNALYYTENVSLLLQHSGEHHIWQDIQFGKASTSKNSTSAIVHGKKETLNYWMAKCNGVQKCAKCDQIPVLKIIAKSATGSYAVELVYVFPADAKDNRRWIGGIICSDVVSPSRNLYNHPVGLSLSHKLSSMVSSVSNPLTTH